MFGSCFRTLAVILVSDFFFSSSTLHTSRTLRFVSNTHRLPILRTRLSAVARLQGSRAFSVFGPSTWNDLPFSLRQKPPLDSFQSLPRDITFFFPEQRPAMFFRFALLHSILLLVGGCLCMCVCLGYSFWTGFYSV